MPKSIGWILFNSKCEGERERGRKKCKKGGGGKKENVRETDQVENIIHQL